MSAGYSRSASPYPAFVSDEEMELAFVTESASLPPRDQDCVILTVREVNGQRRAQHITTQRHGNERHDFAFLSSPDVELALERAHQKADSSGIANIVVWIKPDED